MSDPAKYRTKEEVEEYKVRDPLTDVRNKILEKAYATEEDLKEVEKKVKVIINEAAEFSENSHLPNEAELYTDVYTENE